MAFRIPGPVTVTWNSLALGRFVGGLTIRVNTGLQPVTDDNHGDEPASFIFTGKSCAVELVGLDLASIKAAEPWTRPAPYLLYDDVGTLASDIAKALVITESDGSSVWTAGKACPLDPTEIQLSSTQEVRIPLSFLIIPDAAKKLFSGVPSYIYA